MTMTEAHLSALPEVDAAAGGRAAVGDGGVAAVADAAIELRQLAVGDRAIVRGYRTDSAWTQELRRLGMIAGTILTVIRFAPLGDPVEVRLRGFSLVLRPEEASDLVLERA